MLPRAHHVDPPASQSDAPDIPARPPAFAPAGKGDRHGSHDGVAVEEIARPAGHSSTRTTELVYRKELRPALTRGAEVMDSIFPSLAHQDQSAWFYAIRSVDCELVWVYLIKVIEHREDLTGQVGNFFGCD